MEFLRATGGVVSQGRGTRCSGCTDKPGRALRKRRRNPEDDVEAVKWFRKAAEQGDARAQFDLGRLYEAGRGISRNTVEAYAWFSLSTAAGNGEAQSRLSDLAKRMTPAQNGRG
jgi:TPR repeat protein